MSVGGVLILLLLIVLDAFKIQANIDKNCRNNLANLQKTPKTCCPNAVLRWDTFFNQCSNYTTTSFYPQLTLTKENNLVNACYIGCAWNVSESWDGSNKLFLPATKALLYSLYDGNEELISRSIDYIRECAANVDNILDMWQEAGYIMDADSFRPIRGVSCSWTPLVLNACMQLKLVFDCSIEIESLECVQNIKIIMDCMPLTDERPPKGLQLID